MASNPPHDFTETLPPRPVRSLFLGCASGAQHVPDAVVPLMACIFEQALGPRPEVQLRGPGAWPGVGVFEPTLVAERLLVEARNPLAHPQLLARAAVNRLAVEIRSFDHQGVSLPASARDAQVIANG